MDVASETQHKVIKFLRFMINIPASKLGYPKCIKNYFLPSGNFLVLNSNKTLLRREGLILFCGSA